MDSSQPLPTGKVATPTLVSSYRKPKLPSSILRAGEVALIGAGPGDPELLTLKALNLIQQADVVLYDYLVSDEIMELVPESTILVCVGKRAGHHSVPQEKTNQLLVEFAQSGHKVARIKGGDPSYLVAAAKSCRYSRQQASNFKLFLVSRSGRCDSVCRHPAYSSRLRAICIVCYRTSKA